MRDCGAKTKVVSADINDSQMSEWMVAQDIDGKMLVNDSEIFVNDGEMIDHTLISIT